VIIELGEYKELLTKDSSQPRLLTCVFAARWLSVSWGVGVVVKFSSFCSVVLGGMVLSQEWAISCPNELEDGDEVKLCRTAHTSPVCSGAHLSIHLNLVRSGFPIDVNLPQNKWPSSTATNLKGFFGCMGLGYPVMQIVRNSQSELHVLLVCGRDDYPYVIHGKPETISAIEGLLQGYQAFLTYTEFHPCPGIVGRIPY
jgi:hypothetical protein